MSMLQEHKKYDIVVIGGGLTGVCAAVSAARLGASVALIQNRTVLGGNFSSEVKTPICGATTWNEYPTEKFVRETGILEELVTEIWKQDRNEGNVFLQCKQDMVLLEFVYNEDNIDLYLGTEAYDVEMDGDDRIKSIVARELGGSVELHFDAEVFIDASGDGHIAYSAGAEYRIGREARSEYDETLAPDTADGKVMGSSVTIQVQWKDHPVPFKPRSWAYRYNDEDYLKYRDHSNLDNAFRLWWIEYGGDVDLIGSRNQIQKELYRHVYGIWDHIKNRGDHHAENAVIEWIAPVIGRRESRRFTGDYTLNQNDILERTVFEDSIAYGGYPIDLHPPGGITASDEWPCNHTALKGHYNIPYRCIYSKNIRNLLFAGRNISVSHVALGSTRVMATCAILGQAAGTAAYLCIKNGCGPRCVDIAKLQLLLHRQDCYIPGLNVVDGEDLALKCREVISSSNSKMECTCPDEWLDAENDLGFTFITTGSEIEMLSLRIKCKTEREKIAVDFFKAESLYDFMNTEAIQTFKVEAVKGEQWADVAINRKVIPGIYGVKIHRNGCIQVGWSRENIPGTQGSIRIFEGASGPYYEKQPWSRIYHGSDEWMLIKGTANFMLSPGSYPYQAYNTVNGVCRPTGTGTNMWISAPEKRFPQKLALKWSECIEFNEIHLIFDTNLDNEHSLRKFPEEYCVRDYNIHIGKECGKSERILNIKGNYQRFRVHSFETMKGDEITITVEGTHGSKSARIFEVKVFRK